MDENEIGHMHNLIYTYTTIYTWANIHFKVQIAILAKCFFVKKLSYENLLCVGRKKPFLIQWEQSYFTDAYILCWATNFSSTWEPLSQEGRHNSCWTKCRPLLLSRARYQLHAKSAPALAITQLAYEVWHGMAGIWGELGDYLCDTTPPSSSPTSPAEWEATQHLPAPSIQALCEREGGYNRESKQK